MPSLLAALKLKFQTAPSTPAAGEILVYAKSDKKIYTKDEDGTETELGSGGGGGYVPNPAGQDDGRMLAVDSDALVYVDAPSGGGGGDLSDLEEAVLVEKIWDDGTDEYVWPNAVAPDALAYTNIVFVGPESPITATGGRDVEGDIWMSEEAEASDPDYVPSIDRLSDFNAIFGTGYTAHDYEFNAVSSSLPSGWSWVNQGGATYGERFGGGVINYPSGATINWRMLMQSVTGLPSTWTAYAKISGMGTFSADCFYGLTLYDGTKVIDFSRYTSTPGVRWYVSQWTNVNTYSTSPLSAANRGPMFEDNLYLRLQKVSATSYEFSVSSDGVAWLPMLSAYNVSAYMTPTHLGFGMSNTGSMASTVTCHWFRVR